MQRINATTEVDGDGSNPNQKTNVDLAGVAGTSIVNKNNKTQSAQQNTNFSANVKIRPSQLTRTLFHTRRINVREETNNQINLLNFHQHFPSTSNASNASNTVNVTDKIGNIRPIPVINPGNGTNQSLNTSVPEFLYQLTKMLTDNNSDVIEWKNGKITVHNPVKLGSDVLNKYFRHSKYASFQRQLNYFGFRKLEGKGKMSPCSYINETTTTDIRSLLTVKRKPNGSSDNKNKRKYTSNLNVGVDEPSRKISNIVPVSVPSPLDSVSGTQISSSMNKPQTVGPSIQKSYDPTVSARSASGKGVKHCFNGFQKSKPDQQGAGSVSITCVPNPIHTSYQEQSSTAQCHSNESTTQNSYECANATVNKTTVYTDIPTKENHCVSRNTLSELEKNFQRSLESSEKQENKSTKVEDAPEVIAPPSENQSYRAHVKVEDVVDEIDPSPISETQSYAHAPSTLVSQGNSSSETLSSACLKETRRTTPELDSSLIDLAYIPCLDDVKSNTDIDYTISRGTLQFIDFPNDLDPPNS